MSPVQIMLRNFALAAVAGGFVGYKLSKKRHVEGALLGASVVMMVYGLAKENVIKA
jgi:hypothetical protein